MSEPENEYIRLVDKFDKSKGLYPVVDGSIYLPFKDKLIPSTGNLPFSYEIFQDEYGIIYAKNGRTGKIEFYGDYASTVIQDAINALGKGGIIFVKGGTYYPSKGIILPDGIDLTIRGEGNNTVFKYTNSFLLFDHSPSSPSWTSKIRFRNFKVDRTGSGTASTTILRISYAKYAEFTGIDVIDDYRTGDEYALGGWNNIVAIARNCHIYNKSYGITLGGFLSHAYDNYIENTAKAGIWALGLRSDYPMPSGYSGDTGLVVVENNTLVDAGRVDEGIGLSNASLGVARKNVLLTRNYTTNCFIRCSPSDEILIEANRINGSFVEAVTSGWLPAGKKITLRDNVIDVTTASTNPPITHQADVIDIIGNRIAVNYTASSNIYRATYLNASRFNVLRNYIEVNPASGYNVTFSLFLQSKSPDFSVFVKNNVLRGAYLRGVSVWFNQSFTIAPSIFIEENDANSSLTSQLFQLLFQYYSNTINLFLRRNSTSGSMANTGDVNMVTSGLTIVIIADTDVISPFSNLAGATLKYMKRNRFTATIPANSTSVTVAHGLNGTPSKVVVTPRGNIGNVWVSARDSTNITINCSTAPTADTVVDVDAEI
jgi:hypothetical protein